MKSSLSRREFASLLSLGAAWPFARSLGAGEAPVNFRIRTITAGLHLQSVTRLEQERAISVLPLQRSFRPVRRFSPYRARGAGEKISFDNPYLTQSSVMSL